MRSSERSDGGDGEGYEKSMGKSSVRDMRDEKGTVGRAEEEERRQEGDEKMYKKVGEKSRELRKEEGRGDKGG